MTVGDWATVGSFLLVAMFTAAYKVWRDWSKGLGKRLDHIDQCMDDISDKHTKQITKLDKRIAAIEAWIDGSWLRRSSNRNK